MNNKGFSLVELLAVLVLIATILLIFTPNISNIISDFRENKQTEMLEKSAISAAKEYVVDGNINNKINLSSCTNTTNVTIDVKDLINSKYLQEDKDGFYTDAKITIKYDCNNKKFTNYVFSKEKKLN